MLSQRILVALLLVLLLVSGAPLLGQIGVGQVNGSVTDPQGAVIPGATVRVTNQATNITQQSTTNQSGNYVFAGLRPGSYTISVEMQGFRAAQIPVFPVGVNQTVTQDVRLAVGSMAESVTVTAEAEMIQQTSADLGSVIQERAVASLPLSGRNFTNLLGLTPGASPIQTAQASSIGSWDDRASGVPGGAVMVHPSMNGQFGRSVVYFTDGIINTDFRVQTYAQLPSPDLIQEFKVQSHNDKVEFGGVTGGVVNLVQKSGGNDLHGAIFEFVRNDAFDARNPFTDATRKSPPAFRQNQFGASATGRIIRDKTFFSGGYDGWRYVNYSVSRSIVPSAAELSGDFSKSFLKNRNIYNPLSTRLVDGKYVRDQFVGNQLPANLIQPMVKDFITTYGNTPTPGYSDPSYNYYYVDRTKNTSNNFSIKVDHQFSSSDSLFVKWSRMRTPNFSVREISTTEQHMTALSYGGGLIHVFSPSTILDVRGGTSGRDFNSLTDYRAGLEPMKALGYSDVDRFGGLSLGFENTWAGPGVGGPSSRQNPTWNLGINLTHLRGNHNLKTGFQWIALERVQIGQSQSYSFWDVVTGDPQQPGKHGMSLASALMGLPSRFSGTLPEYGKVAFSIGAWSGYFQDEWRVSPSVTVNMGMRFDATTRPKSNQLGPMGGIDMKTGNWLIGAEEWPALCSVAGRAPCIPGTGLQSIPFGDKIKLVEPDFIPKPIYDNWGPRLSLAWKVDSKTVLRTGYGLSWDSLSAKTQYPQHNYENRWPMVGGFRGDANAVDQSITHLKDLQGKFPGVLPEASPWNATGWMNDPDRKDGYSQQWNVEIQRQLSQSMMLSTAYVGSVNGRLDYAGLANTALTPGAGTPAEVNARRKVPWAGGEFRYSDSIGTSSYNSLQVKFERRFTGGLMSSVAYTWSKSIDDTSGWFNAEEGAGGTRQEYWNPKANRGVSGFDVPHNLSWFTVYDLPAGRGRRWLQSGPASWILGNWQVNYVITARSGQPYTLEVNGDVANVGSGSVRYARPNLVGNAKLDAPSEAMYFNLSAFAVPSLMFGNLGRNSLRGERVVNLDASVNKSIPLGETRELSLRIESFNTANLQTWGLPNRIINAANPGRITSVTTTPRQLQLGLRFSF